MIAAQFWLPNSCLTSCGRLHDAARWPSMLVCDPHAMAAAAAGHPPTRFTLVPLYAAHLPPACSHWTRQSRPLSRRPPMCVATWKMLMIKRWAGWPTCEQITCRLCASMTRCEQGCRKLQQRLLASHALHAPVACCEPSTHHEPGWHGMARHGMAGTWHGWYMAWHCKP